MNVMKKTIKALIALIAVLVIAIGGTLTASAVTVTKILEFDLNDYKDGTVTDNTGHNITLSKVGDGELTVVDGKTGKAVWFKNAGLGVEKLLMNLGRQYTIVTTVKFPSYGTGCRIYGTGIYELGTGFKLGPTHDGNWLYTGAANDEEQFNCFTDTNYSPNVTNIFDENWHTVAMVVDLDKKFTRLYVDGQVQNIARWDNTNVKISDDVTFAMLDAEMTSLTTQAFALGCGGIGDKYYVDYGDFAMQDFTIYNKAFTVNDFRRSLGIPAIDDGDSLEPSYTQKEETVTVVTVDRKNAPNNMEKNSIHEAISYKTVSNIDDVVTDVVDNGNGLLIVSLIVAGGSLILLIAAVVLFVIRKRRTVNVG